MDTRPALLLDRVLRLLQPLVRLLVRNGVTYPAVAAALKRVFLDAARHELAARGMATTDSAITLLSGVHRRDVRELSRGAAAAAAPAPAAMGFAGEVIAHWLVDPAFTDTKGRPRPLQRAADAAAGSFDALVAGLSRDVRPRAVLDELLRLGAVREDETGGLHLERSGFAPREGFAEMSWLFAQNLHDHAAAAAANLQGEANFLEQAMYVDRLGAASAAALQQAAVTAWKQALRQVMAQAQQRFDADATALPEGARRHRARFGVYFYSEEESAS